MSCMRIFFTFLPLYFCTSKTICHYYLSHVSVAINPTGDRCIIQSVTHAAVQVGYITAPNRRSFTTVYSMTMTSYTRRPHPLRDGLSVAVQPERHQIEKNDKT